MDSSSKTSISLDRSSSFHSTIDKHLREDSIIHIISRFTNISFAVLTTATSWLQNQRVNRTIHVELLAHDYDLLLPPGFGGKMVTSSPNTTPGPAPGRMDGFLPNGIKAATDAGSLYGVGKTEFEGSSFLACMPSWAQRVIVKADPEDLVKRLLPAEIVPPGARYVAACFWSFLCVVDDLTEDGDCYDCIETCIESLSTVNSFPNQPVEIVSLSVPRDLPERSKLEDCKIIITAFQNAVSTTRLTAVDDKSEVSFIEGWKIDFWVEVLAVVKALQAERLLHGRAFSMREWLQLRLVTISSRPFMVLVRASLGLPTTLQTAFLPQINQMEILVQAIMGLQNDLLGWQKDHNEGNLLNAVEVLLRDGLPAEDAFSEVLNAHNDMVGSLLCISQLINTSTSVDSSWALYIRAIISFCNAMAEWMISSKRYRTELAPIPGLLRLT